MKPKQGKIQLCEVHPIMRVPCLLCADAARSKETEHESKHDKARTSARSKSKSGKT